MSLIPFQKWSCVWQNASLGATGAMAHKTLQNLEGLLLGSCEEGSLSSLEYVIIFELKLSEEFGKEVISLLVSPALHANNRILSLSKYNLAAAITKPIPQVRRKKFHFSERECQGSSLSYAIVRQSADKSLGQEVLSRRGCADFFTGLGFFM